MYQLFFSFDLQMYMLLETCRLLAAWMVVLPHNPVLITRIMDALLRIKWCKVEAITRGQTRERKERDWRRPDIDLRLETRKAKRVKCFLKYLLEHRGQTSKLVVQILTRTRYGHRLINVHCIDLCVGTYRSFHILKYCLWVWFAARW